MTRLLRSALCAAVLVPLLAGCGSADHETVAPKAADGAAAPRPDASTDAPGMAPVTVPADALTLGPAVGEDGAVTARSGMFTAADTVHVSFPMQGFPPGAPVIVYWTYQDGRSHHVERTTLPATGAHAHYSFGADKGMQAGRYNVEVQVRGRPIGIADFVVQ